ncbi:auxin response factor 11 isoform X2 [Daucus carota subsp. sativus]|uniref:auxin response factor 11 isoform X2 n=1 Tax=Daucus carota subsp. sativus TaxID=79200 RepID=UPI003083B6F4
MHTHFSSLKIAHHCALHIFTTSVASSVLICIHACIVCSVKEEGQGKDDLYAELWKSCAGPLVEVPSRNERVYYFPQGHMEQLQASTNQELDQHIPKFNLPSKILCRVVNVQLLAELDTDEVYAQITLHPEVEQAEPTSPDPCIADPPKPPIHSFVKILTASDTSTHGGFSIFRKHANECLPPLDVTQATPTQDLVAKDLHGFEWRFKHVFRGQPRRHLLTTGWSTFVMAHDLVSWHEEMMVGKCVLGFIVLHNIKVPCLHQLYLARICILGTSQFIVRLNKYMEAVAYGFSLGMRFKMKFEGEDSPERRFSGTIVGVENLSPQWSDSKWRSLKIQWDEPASIHRPLRVSAWDIEPFVASKSSDLALAMKIKRPRPVGNHLSDTTAWYAATPFWYAGSNTTVEQSSLGGTTEFEYIAKQVVWPPKKKEQHDNFINHFSRGLTDESWKDSVNLFRESAQDKPYVTTPPVMPEYDSPASSRAHNGLVHDQVEQVRRTETSASCRLFGIDLRNSNSIQSPTKKVTDSFIATDGGLQASSDTLLEVDRARNLDLRKVKEQVLAEAPKKETDSKHGSNTSKRTRTKVQMQGIAVGRAVDLALVEGYDDLITELERMFEIKGELKERKNWQVVYTDREGDMMLVGDDPWLEFCGIAKKIFIYTTEEVKKMSGNCKLPGSASDGEEKIVSIESETKCEV